MIMWCNVCANDTLALSHAVSAHLFVLLHLLLLVCKHSRVSFLNKPESNNCLFIHNIYGRLSGNLGETSHNLESSCCSVMLSAGHQNVQKVGMGLHELPDFCIEFLFRCLSHRRGKIFRAVCKKRRQNKNKTKKQNVRLSCLLVFLIKASTTLNMAHPDISVRHPGIAEIIVWSSVS